MLGLLRVPESFVNISRFDLFITNDTRWDIWGTRNPMLGGRAGDATVVKLVAGAVHQPPDLSLGEENRGGKA
jgi:hypothetical protein